MKIYFAGSIKGGRERVEIYKEIIKYLKTKGKVLTEHIGDSAITDQGEIDKTPEFIHDRDVAWLSEADILVTELTIPSLGVGYELGLATRMGKKILGLFSGEKIRLSNMIKGNKQIKVFYYQSIDEAKKAIDEFIP